MSKATDRIAAVMKLSDPRAAGLTVDAQTWGSR